MRLESVQFGWLALDKTLNNIIQAINSNEPIEGTGIRISDGSRGKIIETSPGAGGRKEEWPAGVGWQSMVVIDNSSGHCVNKYIWYWGTAPTETATDPPGNPS